MHQAPDFVTVARLADVPPGTATIVRVGDTPIALFNVNGMCYALHNTCRHRGGPLGEGALDETIVTCPWHGWQYDVTTGRNQRNPALSVASYPVRIVGDEVQIEAPGSP